MSDPYAGIAAEDPYAGIGTVEGAKTPPKTASAPAGSGIDTWRALALTGRAIGEGVTGTLAAPHDLGILMQNKMRQGVNALFGTHLQMQPTFSGEFSQALNEAGAYQPQTEGEKTGTALVRGVSGALTGGGAFAGASPALGTTSNLVRTGISGATGAGSAELARRSGGGPVSQFVASLLGGALPFIGSALPRGAPQQGAPSASASVGEGEGTAEATVNATPEMSVQGGGSIPGEVGPAPSAGLTPAQVRAAQSGQSLGMRTTPGQISGSKPLQQLEAKLESQPLTSGPFFALKDANQQVLNRVTGAAIGEDTTSVDSTVLGRAADRLGDVFESVRTPDKIVMADPRATSKVLDAIDQEAEGLLPNNGSIRDNPLVRNLENLTQKGQINGQQLGSLSSKLGRAAYKQMSSPSGDRDLGQALYAVKDHVDDLVQSTLNPTEAAAYADARGQYRNLMLLTSRTGIVNPSTGNVSGTALATKLQQADKAGFLYGKNQSDWYNAARFAQAFKPIVGDSGTATRSMITSPMQLLTSVPINAGVRAYLRSPVARAQAIYGAGRAVANAPRGLLNPMVVPGVTGGLLAQDPNQ